MQGEMMQYQLLRVMLLCSANFFGREMMGKSSTSSDLLQLFITFVPGISMHFPYFGDFYSIFQGPSARGGLVALAVLHRYFPEATETLQRSLKLAFRAQKLQLDSGGESGRHRLGCSWVIFWTRDP